MAETAYATESDLNAALDVTTLNELAANIGDDGATASAVILSCLTDASRDIDAYLGSRYALPITNADALTILRPKCVDIAKFKLMERRFASKYDPAISEAKNNALTWLGRVSRREAALYGADEISVPVVSPDAVALSVGSDIAIFLDPSDPESGGALL